MVENKVDLVAYGGFDWGEVTDEQMLAIAKILNFDPLKT